MLSNVPTSNSDYFGTQTGIAEADSLIDDLLLKLKDTSVKSAVSLLYLAIDRLFEKADADISNQKVKDLLIIN